MYFKLAFVILLCCHPVLSQITEDFSDGDFTNNPSWSGTNSDYEVNSDDQLQSNNSLAATSYLSIENNLNNDNDNEWRFWVKQGFSPSSANFGRLFLTSDSEDLSNTQNGFYIQLGESGSIDAIRLFKMVDGNSTLLCSGADGQIATSFEVNIKITRASNGDWKLFCDQSGGTNFVLLSNTNDSGPLINGFSGMLSTYTVSNASKFYYDDIYIGIEIVDETPPTCIDAAVISATEIELQFNEPLNELSAESTTNYTISPFIDISQAELDAINTSIVHLSLAEPLSNGAAYTLEIENIEDLAGNSSLFQSLNISFLIGESAELGDVIITEIFPDPSPSVGLPTVEFIEIFNKSDKIFDLSNWKINDASSEGTIQEGWLLPNSYGVITATSNIDSFESSYPVTSFPSLNNAGDSLKLSSSNGILLDEVNYTSEWYQDESKASGGYTIERINLIDPCSDALNWSASNAGNGGTPGIQNSIFDNTEDTDPPQLFNTIALSPNYLQIEFNEGIDSSSLIEAVFNAEPSLSISTTYIESAYANGLILSFNENLIPSQAYSFSLTNIKDCWLNPASLNGTFALPELASQGDLVINEILNNPYPGGEDWVELYNNSSKFIDLYQWQFGNYQDDTLSNFVIIPVHYVVPPSSFVVIGEDPQFAIENYPSHNSNVFLQNDLPSYANDSGSVVLLQGSNIMDKVSYNDDWHLSVIDDLDGVSLERIDPNGNSNDAFNWHSAAQDIGFGTPGIKNSQFIAAIYSGDFSFTSPTFSPDNDGFEDILQVNYILEKAGLLGHVQIFDNMGRPIKDLFQNQLLGSTGTFTWDGMNNGGQKSPIGAYVMVFEAFSTDGSVFFTKVKAFTLAGKI
mgnify:CR=1 FL=1